MVGIRVACTTSGRSEDFTKEMSGSLNIDRV